MSTDIERALKLFIVLSRASKVVLEESNQLLDDYNLNPSEFAVLELLYHKGKQPIQKIGQKILLRSGSMTYVVDKLEGRGLLKRVTSLEDKRIIYIVITSTGEELINDIFPKHEQHIKKLMSGLTADEQTQAIDLLKKLGLSVKDLS